MLSPPPHPGDVSMQSIGDTSLMSIDPRSQETKGKEVVTIDRLKLPRSHKTTAARINDISAATKNARAREQRRRADEAVQRALDQQRNEKNSLSRALTVQDIDNAQRARRKQRGPLQAFYLSKAAKKDERTQELRTKRAWAILAADERRFVCHHGHTSSSQVGPSGTGSSTKSPGTVSQVDGYCSDCKRYHYPRGLAANPFEHVAVCPKEKTVVLPIMLTGTAGTAVGSRIGGHARRGGNKLRKEHGRYCPVSMTDEYRTSKTCVFCFDRIQLARSRRIVNGVAKMVRVHGAVECVNSECPSFRVGYTTKGRDNSAAMAIAISGASVLLDKNPLPPFSRLSLGEFLSQLQQHQSNTGSKLLPTSMRMQSRPPTVSGQ